MGATASQRMNIRMNEWLQQLVGDVVPDFLEAMSGF